ncbi:hypothetical protein CEXT_693801 [Caerostris extrusa]|uniref:Uncharacterized protein n=1 Tax=Caerostris extrusa TaxID=172846 RepID=A0AAV4MGN9_CAEEX|nr:hypothetical protein CEXT_693801 [Caerostris extrusa]
MRDVWNDIGLGTSLQFLFVLDVAKASEWKSWAVLVTLCRNQSVFYLCSEGRPGISERVRGTFPQNQGNRLFTPVHSLANFLASAKEEIVLHAIQITSLASTET